MKTLALSAAVSTCAAVLLGGAAQAAPEDKFGVETLSVAVPYSDLDLTTEAGKATLDARIEAAVKQVCAKPGVIRDLKAMGAWSDCRQSAAASAAEQIGAADMATETFAVLF